MIRLSFHSRFREIKEKYRLGEETNKRDYDLSVRERRLALDWGSRQTRDC